MKPSNPINREMLLRLVDLSLDDVATPPAAANGRPRDEALGMAVRQIMNRLSPDASPQNDAEVNAIPVPVYDVAAYIDGTLDDPRKVEAITQAATTDPGLMMEIVSVIRAAREANTSPLPADLRSRLLALGAAETVTTAVAEPESRQASVPPIPAITPAVTRPSAESDGRQSHRPLGLIALLVTAAMLFFAIGWWVRSGVDAETNPVAQDPATNPPPEIVAPPENDQSVDDSELPATDPLLVEDTSDQDALIPNSPDASPPLKTTDLTPPLQDRPTVDVAMDSAPDASQPDSPNPNTMVRPRQPTRPPQTPQVTRLVAQWNQIDGLLLKSTPAVLPTASLSDASAPRSVTEGNSFNLASDAIGAKLRLQTLPLCRAAAKLDGGGELVIAEDTQVELTYGGAIDLQHGSLALLGIKPDAIIRIGKNLANSFALASPQGGSIVVRKTVTGMEVDVSGQPVTINGQSFSGSRLVVDETTMTAKRVDDAPERLPRWTRERVDRIEVGRNVLAQLSESTDVRVTMMQSLRSGSVRGPAAATLRMWLVAASQGNLLRLIGSSDPMLREAALQHLRRVDPTDPRHRVLWRTLQTQGQNPRTFASVRSYFVELWSQRRPNATRTDQLLRMLQSPEPAARVTANYLLHSFYGPGPRFDLNANAAARTRSANAWRAVINRVDQR